MQKFLMILWLALTSSIAYGDRSDLILQGREKGGKVIIAPKNSSGAVSATITIDPEAQTVSVANGQLLVNGVQANFAIGSIQQSILTEANFQAQMGSDWVAMKGQDISGSKLCTDYSICTLPDARNRFLRNSDAADTNLRGLVSDTTAKNSLALTGNVAGGTASLTGSVSGGTASGTFASTTHTHGLPGHNHGMGGSLGQTLAVSDLDVANRSLSSGSATGGTWTFGSGSASGGTWSFSGYMTAANFEHSHSGTFASSSHNHRWGYGDGSYNLQSFNSNGTVRLVLQYITSGASGSGFGASWPGNLQNVSYYTETPSATASVGADDVSSNKTVTGSVSRTGNSTVSGTVTRATDSSVSGSTDIDHSHALSGNIGKVTNGCAGDTTDNCTTSSISGTASVSNTPASNGTLAVSNTAANNGTLAIGSGDSETAPDHIIVNTFVKIN